MNKNQILTYCKSNLLSDTLTDNAFFSSIYFNAKFKELITKYQFKCGNPIYLKVYHLSIINYILQIFGLGLYHTTIEIENTEYSFGRTKEEIAGIFTNKVGIMEKKLRLKEKLYLGNTLYSPTTIYKLLSFQSVYWMGNTYDPFVKNCNHFTKYFSQMLLGQHVNYPDYINRLSDCGMLFSSFYPPIKRLYGDVVFKVENSDLKGLGEGEEKISSKERSNIIDIDADMNKKIIENESDFCFEKLKHNNLIKRTKSDNSIDCNCQHHRNNSAISAKNVSDEKINVEKDIEVELALKHQNSNMFYSVGPNEHNPFSSIIYLNPYLTKLKSFINKESYIEILVSKNKIYFFCEQIKLIEQNIENNEYSKAERILENLINDFTNYRSILDQTKITFNNKYINSHSKQSITFLLKLYHLFHYVSYLQNNIEKQETIVNKILKLDSNDYYSIIELAYVRYQQTKFPECDELLRSAITFCEKTKHDIYISKIKEIEKIFTTNL